MGSHRPHRSPRSASNRVAPADVVDGFVGKHSKFGATAQWLMSHPDEVKAVLAVVYVAMAVWLIGAAVLRIVLLLDEGDTLDPLPFISGGLGLLALLALFPAMDDFRERRQNRPEEGDLRQPSP